MEHVEKHLQQQNFRLKGNFSKNEYLGALLEKSLRSLQKVKKVQALEAIKLYARANTIKDNYEYKIHNDYFDQLKKNKLSSVLKTTYKWKEFIKFHYFQQWKTLTFEE